MVTDCDEENIIQMKEDLLNLSVAPPEEDALVLMKNRFVKGQGPDAAQVVAAIEDAYKRLLSRSMETETRLAAKERADEAAIKVFAENLQQLLPMGKHTRSITIILTSSFL